MLLVLGIVFLVLIAIGLPIAFAMGLATVIPLIGIDVPLSVIIQRMFGGMDSSALLAIPTFLLAGDLMVAGKISDGLIRFAGNAIGHIRGGMANTTVLSSTIFAGVSGSAAADTAAVGSIMLPTMKEKGYPPGYSVTLLAFSGALGPIIPPSIMMVIYGGITGVSIGKLFLAGAIPGLIMATTYFLVNFFWVPKLGVQSEPRATLKELGHSFIHSIWALFAPFIIIFGILSGVFTPTEAGVIAAVYSFFVGYFVYRGFTMKQLPEILLRTCLTTAIIMTIIAVANAFAWIIARAKVADTLKDLLFSISPSPAIVMLIIVAFLLLIGCFIETVAATIIFVPVLFDIGSSIGYDPLQFATVVVICLVLGGVTPPVGVLLFISAGIAKISIKETLRYILPFLAVAVLVVLLVAFVPSVTTYLPNVFMD